ncbi:MAG: response regulator [Deltaproteobacteria bacterium]|nr:response regulator [Deltaproteobacteria bacterium]
MRVLLIEDDESIREVLKMVLEAEQALATPDAELVVETAATGLEALELVTRVRPDLVLLDLTLNGEDGFEVFKALRSAPGCADLVCIAVTAHNLWEFEVQAKSAGFAGFITKPIDFERSLFPLMRRLLAKSDQAA